MAHDPPPDLLDDDLESLYPGLESGSSSISSTQENSPLVGPVPGSDFSIDAANLLLERFQLQFMDSLYLDPTGSVTAAPSQEPRNATELFATTPTSAGLSMASAPNIDPAVQFIRQPGSDLMSSNPSTQQQQPTESSSTRKQKQKQKHKKVQATATAGHVPPPASAAAGFPPPAPPAQHHLGYSRYYRSRHSEPEHDLFFDTDTILNRSGEEETFLRGHPPRFSQMAGGPDVSHRTNYATYYTSQDTFALANVYHAEEEDLASLSEDEESGSASASGSGANAAAAAAAAAEAAARGLPRLQAVVVGGASGSCTRAVPMMPSGTEVAAPPIEPASPTSNRFDECTPQELPLPALTPPGKGKHKKKAGGQTPRSCIQHITRQHHHNSSPSSSSSYQLLYPQHQTQSSSSTSSSQDTCIFPPIQTQPEPAFALFPPIETDQFDPRYAIPLLPDSAPKPGAAASLCAPVTAAGLDEAGASDLVGEFLVGFKKGLVIGGTSS